MLSLEDTGIPAQDVFLYELSANVSYVKYKNVLSTSSLKEVLQKLWNLSYIAEMGRVRNGALLPKNRYTMYTFKYIE